MAMFAKPYEFEETGVGCGTHGDPTCLCDVVITKPVEVKHSLGAEVSAVLFSNSVNKHFNVREDFVGHVGSLLKLYDAAAKRFRGSTALARADIEIAHADSREHYGDRRPFHPTVEQQAWMRRNIPNSQAAFIVDQTQDTVRMWRKANGVHIDLGLSDFQRKNANQTRRNLRAPTYNQFKINQNDPEVRAILEDRTLTIIKAGERLGVDKGVVHRARKRLGIASLPKSGKRCTIDWSDPNVIAVLDGGMTEREASRALGCSPSQINRKRHARDGVTLANQ